MEAQHKVLAEPTGSWRDARLLVTDVFEAPPVILRVGDSIVGTLGNFSASTGKAKSKKTFNVCAIVAAAMTGSTVLNYSASLPPEKRRILYVDTEQSRFHCKRARRYASAAVGVLVPAWLCNQRSAEEDRGGYL